MFRIAVLLLFALTASAQAQVRKIDLPPAEAAQSDMHIVLVRHAYPACSDIQCDLNAEGYEQAKELARFIANARTRDVKLEAVYASSACRTILTATPSADQAGLPVSAYPARDGYPLCGYLGDGDGLKRPDASRKPQAGVTLGEGPAASRFGLIDALAAEAEASGDGVPRMVLAADHSNFVCEWFKRLGVPESDYADECGEGGLAHTDYADIYWLYDAVPGEGSAWRLAHFENAFDRGVPNAYEQ